MRPIDEEEEDGDEEEAVAFLNARLAETTLKCSDACQWQIHVIDAKRIINITDIFNTPF